MIVADASALVAVVLGGSDVEDVRDAWADDAGSIVAVSAVSVTEALVALESRRGPDATRDPEQLPSECGAVIVTHDEHHTAAAHAVRAAR